MTGRCFVAQGFWKPFSQSSLSSQITAQVVKWFISGKWFIGYNFGKDDGAESNFGTHIELIAFNIL